MLWDRQQLIFVCVLNHNACYIISGIIFNVCATAFVVYNNVVTKYERQVQNKEGNNFTFKIETV